MGYGKHFNDMYTGSMFGQSTDVFAVWGYVISNMRVTKLEAHVELNPRVMATVFGSDPRTMIDAIAVLEAPDDESRSTTHEGRRLVLMTARTSGPMQFLVVNGYKYRHTRDEDARKATNRKSQRKRYARKKVEAAGEEWDPGMWKDSALSSGTVQALDAGTATGDWESFVSSGDAPEDDAPDSWDKVAEADARCAATHSASGWDPDGADKALTVQKPMEKEGL